MALRADWHLHERLDRQEVVVGSSNRAFGLVFAVAFLLLAGFLLWRDLHVWAAASASTAIGFALLSLLAPVALRPLNRLWTAFGLALYRVINPLTMGLIFITIFVPAGLFMRLTGRDVLGLAFNQRAKSYWIERAPQPWGEEAFKRQF